METPTAREMKNFHKITKGLNRRVKNVLLDANLLTKKQILFAILFDDTHNTLSDLRNCGNKTISEIKDFFSTENISNKCPHCGGRV